MSSPSTAGMVDVDEVDEVEVDDVAGAVSFLCSPDASYVSGQGVYVRGGP